MWVKVVASPSSGVWVNDSIQCLAGNIFDFDNKFPGLVSFKWDLGGGSTAVTKTVSKSFPSVGDYPIIHEATSVDGCTGKDTIIVKVKPNVDPAFTGLPATACQGGPAIMLNPKTTGGIFKGETFTGNSFYPTKTGKVTIKYVVQDQHCPDSSTADITITPKPILNLGKDTTLCDGASTDITVSIPGTVLWNDGSTANIKTVSLPGTYGAVVDNAGCKASDSINIKVNVSPSISLPMDTVLCSGSMVKLVAPFLPNTTIKWSTGSSDTVIYVSAAGTYSCTVTNACGSATDDVTVNLMMGDCDLFIPTAFTPNGDNRNESFKIFGRGAVPILFLVYNRWGDKVFDSHEKNVYEWDGYYMNDVCQEGIYTFIYRYELKTGDRVRRKTISGTIMLMR
jgi:gliding motility-associated-like protein